MLSVLSAHVDTLIAYRHFLWVHACILEGCQFYFLFRVEVSHLAANHKERRKETFQAIVTNILINSWKSRFNLMMLLEIGFSLFFDML